MNFVIFVWTLLNNSVWLRIKCVYPQIDRCLFSLVVIFSCEVSKNWFIWNIYLICIIYIWKTIQWHRPTTDATVLVKIWSGQLYPLKASLHDPIGSFSINDATRRVDDHDRRVTRRERERECVWDTSTCKISFLYVEKLLHSSINGRTLDNRHLLLLRMSQMYSCWKRPHSIGLIQTTTSSSLHYYLNISNIWVPHLINPDPKMI